MHLIVILISPLIFLSQENGCHDSAYMEAALQEQYPSLKVRPSLPPSLPPSSFLPTLLPSALLSLGVYLRYGDGDCHPLRL